MSLKVTIMQPKRKAKIAYQAVLHSLEEQMSELGDFGDDEEVLLTAPLGATEEQVDRAMAELGCSPDEAVKQ
ncbi:MAG TPA: hypothetical protein VFR42_07750 [Candidatus Acidoferrum sp.]|nr:hypothetical protein [Candidatus Acidoferrum sp.]